MKLSANPEENIESFERDPTKVLEVIEDWQNELSSNFDDYISRPSYYEKPRIGSLSIVLSYWCDHIGISDAGVFRELWRKIEALSSPDIPWGSHPSGEELKEIASKAIHVKDRIITDARIRIKKLRLEDGDFSKEASQKTDYEEISNKYVVEIDLYRYSDIASLLQDEHGLGAKATEQLDKQILEFVKKAAQKIGMELYQIPHNQFGDAVIIAFKNAYEAVKFAEAFQLSTIEYNSGKNTELTQRFFRVGIAKGELIIRRLLTTGGEFKAYKLSGTPISRAKRLESDCNIEEVLICSETFSDLPKDLQAAYGPEEEVKGKRREIFKAHRRKVVKIALADKNSKESDGFDKICEINTNIENVILADDLVIRDIECDYGIRVSDNNSISGADAVTAIFHKNNESIYLEVICYDKLGDCNSSSIGNISSDFLSRSRTIAEEIPRRPISCVFALVSNFISQEQEHEANLKINEALQDSPIPAEVRVYQFELLKKKFKIL